MDSLGIVAGPPAKRWGWRGVPRAWRQVIGALFRTAVLALCAVIAARLLGGALLYASVAVVCGLLFVLPAYASARRAESLLQLSLTDPLTGVGNRRSLNMRLEQEIARCSRGRYTVAVLMIDVDKLKQINDGAGHRAGDEALQMVANALLRSVRISDVVGRFGGDEFLVIAPETSAADACALGERIAAATRKNTMMSNAGRCVGLSIGVATTATTGADLRRLLETADSAMYEAKEQGGNRVVGPGRNRLPNVVPIRPLTRK